MIRQTCSNLSDCRNDGDAAKPVEAAKHTGAGARNREVGHEGTRRDWTQNLQGELASIAPEGGAMYLRNRRASEWLCFDFCEGVRLKRR
jgi:hypothetical protein